MPEFYTTEEVVNSEFLFISYSHANKPIIDACADFLIGEGVRLWYDKSLTPGDEWRAEVENLLRHQNCCGVILFCSTDALKSVNIARERAILLDEQNKRGKDKYPVFIVNVSGDGNTISYMQMLKRTFDMLDEKTIDKDFTLDIIYDILKIVGGDPICSMASKAGYEKDILTAIKRKVPQVVDKNAIMQEEMEEHLKADKIISVEFGRSRRNGNEVPIVWSFVYNDGENAVLISRECLAQRLGGSDLDGWLNSEFLAAFDEEERKKIRDSVRLLSVDEIANAELNVLVSGEEWWLSDCRGSLQMIIRDDGTLYKNGYNNKRFAKGVRPVVVLSMNDVRELVFNQKR